MPMPLRNSLSDYRYAYQRQEKDPETGKEAFQLRLWDARIGRWLTTGMCSLEAINQLIKLADILYLKFKDPLIIVELSDVGKII